MSSIKRGFDGSERNYLRGSYSSSYKKQRVSAPSTYRRKSVSGLYRSTGMLVAARRNMARAELKSVDISGQNQTSVTAATSTINVGPIPVIGAGFWNRIGATIKMKSLYFKYMIEQNNGIAAQIAEGKWHVDIVYDRQPNGALPAVADIFADYDNSGASSTNFDSSVNPTYKDRFVVLKKFTFYTPPINANGLMAGLLGDASGMPVNYTGGHGDPYAGDCFINLRGLESRFRASAGNIADYATGSILIVSRSQRGIPGAGNYAFNMKYDMRLRFYD